MGRWYGPGGANREDSREGGGGVAGGSQPGTKPCPNGVLLTNPDAEFNGTKMMDSMGRMWGCPSTMGDTETNPTVTPDAAIPNTTATTPAAEGAGMWGMSPELMALYSGILGRGQDILGMPLGFGPGVKEATFGQGFDQLQGQGAATGNALQQSLARVGMLDTGAGMGMMGQNAWNTQQGVSNLMRDLLMQEEALKGTQLADRTQMLNSIFGGGLGAEGMTEQLNAARRGESQDFWNQMIQLLAMYKG